MSLPLFGEGEFALVFDHLETALNKETGAISVPGGDHDLAAMLADTAARQQDVDGLGKYAPLAEESANRFSHRLYQGIAHRAWGVLHRLSGEYDPAEKRFQHALDAFTALDARWQIGRTLADIGDLASARGDVHRARDAYGRALEHFGALGALPDANRTQAALDALPPS